MAKLLLVQTFFLTICWFAFVSGDIPELDEFESFITGKVIKKFRPWAQTSKNGERKEQFAVLMLMNSDEFGNWNKFEFLPELPDELDTNTKVIPKDVKDMVNYVAVKPGTANMGGGKRRFLHSEQRIYKKFLDPMLLKYNQQHGHMPKAIVLYSWIVPCTKQWCPSKDTNSCTDHTLKELKNYVKEGNKRVIVAYTTKGTGMTGSTECNPEETEENFRDANFDVLRINYKEDEEAMIEGLIKLGRLLEILE